MILISLIDVTNFCNDKGYDFFPVRQGKGVRAILFKDGLKIKEGDEIFKNWLDCQKEVYTKLYKILIK